MTFKFEGFSAFPITPADEEGRVDAKNLQTLVSRLMDAKVHSIGLLGSTGTYPYLTRSERRRAIEAAAEVCAGKVPLLVGIGALRTSDVIELARDAQEAGADAALLAPVSYVPLTEEEVFAHYESAAKVSDLPICIYNNPSTTNFNFSIDLIARLSQVQNIRAIKNPTHGQSIAPELQELRTKCQKGFSIGHSGDWNVTEALIEGSQVWYSVLGGLFPGPCLKIVESVAERDFDKARDINAHLKPIWDLFIEQGGSLRVIYAAAHHLHLTRHGPPRPILPLNGEVRRRIAATLEKLDLC